MASEEKNNVMTENEYYMKISISVRRNTMTIVQEIRETGYLG